MWEKSNNSSDVEFEDVSKIKAKVLAKSGLFAVGPKYQPKPPISKSKCSRKKVAINLHEDIFKRPSSEFLEDPGSNLQFKMNQNRQLQ